MTKTFKIEDLPNLKKSWSRRKKVLVTLAIAIPVLGIAGLVTYKLTRPHAPDPAKLETKQAVKYLASKDFASLPEREKEDYMARLRAKNGDNPRMFFSNDLTQEERHAMFKNTRQIMQKMMKERMNKFFAMSKEEQNQELDRIIKEMEARRANRPQGGQGGRGPGGQGGQGGQGGRGPGGGNMAARQQQRYEATDSTTRAQMTEFRKLLQQRRQATAGSSSATTTTATTTTTNK